MPTFFLDFLNGNDANDGSDWANAWKTITSGATAARIAPGDTIKCAKSDDPVSLGVTGNVTKDSGTITLSAAVTKTIDQCETAWTASANVTSTRQSASGIYKQEGSYFANHVVAAGFSTGKIAYYPLGSTEDFSAYTAITLLFYVYAATAAGVLKICLCSDATGDTIVDEFTIPEHLSASTSWRPLRIAKDGGGSLGSSIQSIALYAISDPGAITIRTDNIEATNAFHHGCIIGRNTGDGTKEDLWYTVRSIVGTTLTIGNCYGSGRDGEWLGATNAARALSYINPTEVNSVTTFNTLQDSGTVGNPITFSGGWNTSSGLQDGMTVISVPYWGITNVYGINGTSKNFITVENFGFVRFTQALYANSCQNFQATNIIASGTQGFYSTAGILTTLETIRLTCLITGSIPINISTASYSWIRIKDAILCGVTGYAGLAVSSNTNTVFLEDFYIAYAARGIDGNNDIFGNNIEFDGCGFCFDQSYNPRYRFKTVETNGCTLLDTSINPAGVIYNPVISIDGLDGNAATKISYYRYGTTEADTADAQDGTCVKISPDSSKGNDAVLCHEVPIGNLAFPASTLVTVTLNIKKSADYDGNTPVIHILDNGKVVATTTCTGISTSYQEFTIQYTSSVNEVLHLTISCDGSAGSIFVDEVTW